MKNYLEIMEEQIGKRIIKEERKPDLSMNDWNFILRCLSTLKIISKCLDDINAERVKDKTVTAFEVLEDITGHKIITEDEE